MLDLHVHAAHRLWCFGQVFAALVEADISHVHRMTGRTADETNCVLAPPYSTDAPFGMGGALSIFHTVRGACYVSILLNTEGLFFFY